MVFRSRRQSKFTVATMFLENQSISIMQNMRGLIVGDKAYCKVGVRPLPVC